MVTPPVVTRQSLCGPKVLPKFLKVVPKLSQICVKVVSNLCQSCVEAFSKFCQSCLKIVSLLKGRTKWPGKKFSSNLLVIVRELVHESLLVTSIRWCDQCDINGRPLCQLPPILKHIQVYKSKGARSVGKYIYMCLNTYSCAHQAIMSAVIFAIFIQLFLNSQNLRI